MTKPLLIACILLSLAAAVLGFLNRGTLLTTRGELEGAKSQIATTNQLLDSQDRVLASIVEVLRPV